ncbi:hypothetical protein BCON_0678g00010 [Botryotinia convoluta]|uniref:Uncharacterized protein n=1 Tax=Botryotinia convoluta TaxID=54673 RepID=A0A4Z1HFU0_9HELO|nr:hypothetical protein BCON_0678g00010 [Botryotinia convoluta]
MDTNDAREFCKEFDLRREKSAKPVLKADNLILLLTHHWARDTSIFPTEDQHLALATIMLLLIYTGYRPAELVHAAKGKISGCHQTYEDDNWDSGYENLDETKDDNPPYENLKPWNNPQNSDYDDEDNDDIFTREYKALCYEDIRLWIVRNPAPGERDLLGRSLSLIIKELTGNPNQYRRDYFDYIHNEKLKRQLNKALTSKYIKPTVYYQLPEQTRLQEVLCNHSRHISMDNIITRRIRAIDLMVALSNRQEQQIQYSNRSSRDGLLMWLESHAVGEGDDWMGDGDYEEKMRQGVAFEGNHVIYACGEIWCPYLRSYSKYPMNLKLFNEMCELILYKNAEGSMPCVVPAFRRYLTIEEELQIRQQFHNTWRWNNQVMWSGMPREYAQAWADEHDMATLTTAMGPLMTPEHPLCLKRQKSSGAWSKYIKGASAVFAYHILRGERVIVLSPPPPERFHPSGQTNYQAIEEPILKGRKEDGTRLRLEMVHPMVEGAENFIYQIWPADKTNTWIERFGTLAQGTRCWRSVKVIPKKARIMDTSKCGVKDRVVALAQESEFDENTREALKEKVLLANAGFEPIRTSCFPRLWAREEYTVVTVLRADLYRTALSTPSTLTGSVIDNVIFEFVQLLQEESSWRLRVQSLFLEAASKPFPAMFGPDWKEEHDILDLDGPGELSLPEDNASALKLICAIIHHRNKDVTQFLAAGDVLGVGSPSQRTSMIVSMP